ncbi:MAG: hypothetical protein ACRD5H_03185, partial [Nitrososphaerales archaeon]
VTAFVLVQPILTTYAQVSEEGIPAFDDCDISTDNVPEDPISQNTIKKGNIDLVKTIHAEKEIFDCVLDQGNLDVIVDVTTYIELYFNITEQEVISTNVIVTSCVKDETTADIYGCEAYTPGEDTIPVSSCVELTEITHPQEMDTVNKGNAALTIETQKEVFECDFGGITVIKKVDIVLITEIYENLASQTIQDVQAHAMKCTVLVTDSDTGNTRRDATVESCVFSEVQVDGPF